LAEEQRAWAEEVRRKTEAVLGGSEVAVGVV
jgi:hypothetical protein